MTKRDLLGLADWIIEEVTGETCSPEDIESMVNEWLSLNVADAEG